MTRFAIGAAAAAIVLSTGCVSSRQARNVAPGTFLGDTSSLLKALLVDRKAGTDWSSYDVKSIVGYWSNLAMHRLCLDRRAAGCRKPDAGLVQP